MSLFECVFGNFIDLCMLLRILALYGDFLWCWRWRIYSSKNAMENGAAFWAAVGFRAGERLWLFFQPGHSSWDCIHCSGQF